MTRIRKTDRAIHPNGRPHRPLSDTARLPRNLTLSEWISDWLRTGADATTEVIRASTPVAEPPGVFIFAAKLPSTLDNLTHLMSKGLSSVVIDKVTVRPGVLAVT